MIFLTVYTFFQEFIYYSSICFSTLAFYGAFKVLTKSFNFDYISLAILSCSWLLDGLFNVYFTYFIWFCMEYVISFLMTEKSSLKSVWLPFICFKVSYNLLYSPLSTLYPSIKSDILFYVLLSRLLRLLF